MVRRSVPGYGRKWSWPSVRYCSICLERLKKTQASWPLNLNTDPSVYKAKVQYYSRLIVHYGSLVEADILALAASIQELSAGSRRARTGMWCALVVTLLMQEQEENKESKVTGIADGDKADTASTTSATANTTVTDNTATVTTSVTVVCATTTTASVATVGK